MPQPHCRHCQHLLYTSATDLSYDCLILRSHHDEVSDWIINFLWGKTEGEKRENQIFYCRR